jgi:hypothetical protein
MSIRACALKTIFGVNTAELALPGRWCCPLEGEAAAGCFGGESFNGRN